MSDHLRLISSYGDPRATTLVRPDGRVYYETRQEPERTVLFHRTSAGKAKEGELAGYINWHPPSSMGLGHSEPTSTAEFLRRSANNTRTFAGPYGEEYIWKELYTGPGDYELRRAGSLESEPVAIFRTERTRLFKKNVLGYLDISPTGQNILDYVVLTWIFMRRIHMVNNRMDHEMY